MSVRKKFDKELYDQCDKTAKQRVIEIFTAEGFDIIENPKRTQVDLIVLKNGETLFYVETEKKFNWTMTNFPFETINFPSRKEKFAKLDKPTLFIMFSRDMSNYLCITGEDLIASELKMVRNKYVPVGEYFFQVPINKALFNNIKGVQNVKTTENKLNNQI